MARAAVCLEMSAIRQQKREGMMGFLDEITKVVGAKFSVEQAKGA